jgi:hypothetical protein
MAYPLSQGVLLLTPSPSTHVSPLQHVLDVSKALHIGMAYPLNQGVLPLTPNPSTHVFPLKHVLDTSKTDKLEVADFVDLLCRRLSSPMSDDAKADMVQAIRSHVDAVELVEKYGVAGLSRRPTQSCERTAKPRSSSQDKALPFCRGR